LAVANHAKQGTSLFIQDKKTVVASLPVKVTFIWTSVRPLTWYPQHPSLWIGMIRIWWVGCSVDEEFFAQLDPECSGQW